MNTRTLFAILALSLAPVMAGASSPPPNEPVTYRDGDGPRYQDAHQRLDSRYRDERYREDSDRWDEEDQDASRMYDDDRGRAPPDNDVDEVIVRSAPNEVDYSAYGEAPSFRWLDRNSDGVIDEREARAYPPLANDFLYASGNRSAVPPARYKWWARQLH